MLPSRPNVIRSEFLGRDALVAAGPGCARGGCIVDGEDDVDLGVHCEHVAGDLISGAWFDPALMDRTVLGVWQDAAQAGQEALASFAGVCKVEGEVEEIGLAVPVAHGRNARPTRPSAKPAAALSGATSGHCAGHGDGLGDDGHAALRSPVEQRAVEGRIDGCGDQHVDAVRECARLPLVAAGRRDRSAGLLGP